MNLTSHDILWSDCVGDAGIGILPLQSDVWVVRKFGPMISSMSSGNIVWHVPLFQRIGTVSKDSFVLRTPLETCKDLHVLRTSRNVR